MAAIKARILARHPIFQLLVLVLCLGCATREISPTPTPRPGLTPTAIPTTSPPPPPTRTPTPTTPSVILLAPPEADPQTTRAIQDKLAALTAASGWGLEHRPSPAPADLSPEDSLIVALSPYPGLSDLIQANPDRQFLAIGFADLPPRENLSVIGTEGYRPDRQAFIAGFLAAIVTEDWRVGVISVGDTPAGRATRGGFLNGVRFFCGLCLPIYPPFEGYPLFVEVPSNADRAAWRSAADSLIAAAVDTVYVDPVLQDDGLLDYLAESGVNLIGGKTPADDLGSSWIAAVIFQPAQAIEALWPEISRGEGGRALPMPLAIEMINPDLLSPGRYRLVREAIEDLTGGAIDTGIDPQTGEAR